MNDFYKNLGLAVLRLSYSLSRSLLENSFKITKYLGKKTFQICNDCGIQLTQLLIKAKNKYLKKNKSILRRKNNISSNY